MEEEGRRVGIREGDVMKETEGKRGYEHGTSNQSDTIADFSDGGRSQEPRNAGSF